MKRCRICLEEKTLAEFTANNQTKDGLHTMCRECLSLHKKEDYKNKWFRYQNRLKKHQCKKAGIIYDLDEEYLKSIFTENCPVYQTPFVLFDKRHPNSPALDRINPKKGYVKGNVAYISSRANRIKYDADPKELRLIADWVDKAVDTH